MAIARLANVLRYIRGLVDAPESGQPTDAQLVERFLTERDESVFASLVERHGSMVLGVGRAVLGEWHGAEDVFQATFMVLAVKAKSLRKRDSLGSWLYGVAYRIALNARAKAARRRKHEKRVGDMNRTEPSERPAPELGPLLMRELDGLPEKYRAPLVLCYLEGMTNEEAARQLCWPSGTVKGRLARAREVLRGRLARRGVTAGAAALATFTADYGLAATIPGPLLTAVISTAGPLAWGEISLASLAAGPPALLARQALRQSLLNTLLAITLLGAAVMTGGAGWFFYQRSADLGAVVAAPSNPAAFRLVASFAEDEHYRGQPVPLAFSADGQRLALLARHDAEADDLVLQQIGSGKTIATIRTEPGLRAATSDGKSVALIYGGEAAGAVTVEIRDLATLQVVRRWEEKDCRVAPSDAILAGESLVLVGRVDDAPQPLPIAGGVGLAGGAGFGGFLDSQPTVAVLDVTGKRKPRLHGLEGVGSVLAAQLGGTGDQRCAVLLVKRQEASDLEVIDLATGKCRKLADHLTATALTISPDGKSVAVQTAENTVQFWNIDGSAKPIALRDRDNTLVCFAFAPDGKTLASAGSDRTVKLWDLETGNVRQVLPHPRVQQIVFSADGRLLATAAPEGVKVWSLEEGDK
jgi:RNA polymerase sigma factor (sigma-70 family)